MEREFRKARLEYVTAKAQGDEKGLKAARERLRRVDERLNEFTEATGRKRRREREYQPVNAKWPEQAQTPAGKTLTEGGKGATIEARGDERMDVVQSPIEQRNTGKGNPNAMLHFNRPLNNRQQQLLDQMPSYDSRTTVRKQDVNLRDISALTEKTGDEFALFTRRGERMVVRGNAYMTNINQEDAERMAAEGWRWSGHTHPGTDYLCLIPSDGDKLILRVFGQEQSCIVNSMGLWNTFGEDDL